MHDQTSSLAEAQLAVAVPALERLANDWVMFSERDLVDADDAIAAERNVRSEYAAAALGEIRQLADKAARTTAEAEPVPPLPPGKWGRVELPGRREHTGFIAEETRFGQQAAVVRNWDGAEVATVYGGPGCQMVWLPAPLKRPEPQRAITAGPVTWRADEDDPDDYVPHARGCNDPNCNGDCIPF